MTDLVNRLDFWLMIIGLVFLVWLEAERFLAWWQARSVKRSDHRRPIVMSRDDEWDDDDQDEDTAPAPPAQDGASACARPETPRTEACAPAPLNLVELTAYEQNMIRKMVDSYARVRATGQRPSKSRIIKDVTGYSRSGDPNSRYARYSELYNLLLETPDPAVQPTHRERQEVS